MKSFLIFFSMMAGMTMAEIYNPPPSSTRTLDFEGDSLIDILSIKDGSEIYSIMPNDRALMDSGGNQLVSWYSDVEWSNSIAPYIPTTSAPASHNQPLSTITNAGTMAAEVTQTWYRASNPSNFVADGSTVVLYSTNDAPTANELVHANWVRGLFSQGLYFYNSTNTTTGGYSTNSFLYQTNLPASWTRSYVITGANQYVGDVFTPRMITNPHGPAVVSAYLGRSSGGGDAITLKPELYFTVDKTNTVYEAADVQPQAVATGSNLVQWVIPFPDQATAYALRRLKITSMAGSPTLTIYGGTNTPSAFSITEGSGATASGDFKADGSVAMTGNLNMGGSSITNYGPGDSYVLPTTLTSAATVTITRATGSMGKLTLTNAAVIEFSATDWNTNGVGQFTLLLNAGTNSITWTNAVSQVSWATAPTIPTNGTVANPLLFFRNWLSSTNWIGRQ